MTPRPDASWLRPRGSNQSGMSQYNERVLLQAIRLHGSMPKADLARLTRLSTQTVALIIDRLLEQGLVLKCACLLYTSPSPRDLSTSRMPSSA